MKSFYPQFTDRGVFLRGSRNQLIGRPDAPGQPFTTLDEARDMADWLEMSAREKVTRPAGAVLLGTCVVQECR